MCGSCGSGGGLRRPYFRNRANPNRRLVRGKTSHGGSSLSTADTAKVSRALKRATKKVQNAKVKKVLAKVQKMLHGK